jgi:menaquinone reductase, multiheme cytochrome c subunit
MDSDSTPLLTFPRWANKAAIGVLLAAAVLPLYAGLLLGYGAHPTTLNVGYAPVQPVPYSHAVHVGKLGLDCRYCHTTVEQAAMAALPPTDVCMNCHKTILPDSPQLAEVRKSYVEGTPVPWIKVHDLADYVFFDHSAHLTAGVGCIECHGPVQQMQRVQTVKPLNMAWCLECHRSPDGHLRPRDQVTNMDWTEGDSPIFVGRKLGQSPDAAARAALGKDLRQKYHVNPNTDCVTCHR